MGALVLFPTVEFAILFALVLPLSWALMPRPHAWKPVMLVVSYAFYAAADWHFCLLLGGVTVGNQLAARAIARVGGGDTRAGRRLCAAAVGADLAVLGVFKYYGFFVDEVNGTLAGLGLGLLLPLATLALPVGISFTAMSMTPAPTATRAGSRGRWSWGRNSRARTMGPATRCGKKLRYRPTSSSGAGATRPRLTSTT